MTGRSLFDIDDEQSFDLQTHECYHDDTTESAGPANVEAVDDSPFETNVHIHYDKKHRAKYVPSARR